jgi:hypothetical protein
MGERVVPELDDDEAAAVGVMLAAYFDRVGVKLPVLLFKDGTVGIADGRCRFGCEESVRRTGH